MQVQQTITLDERQVKDILTKALKLGKDSQIKFNHYRGDPHDSRDSPSTTVVITAKTEINPE